MSNTGCIIPTSHWYDTMLYSRYCWRWIRYIIWHARLVLRIISTIPSRLLRCVHSSHYVTIISLVMFQANPKAQFCVAHFSFKILTANITTVLFQTSTMGTINMLGLAKRVKARILLASTSEIYGDPNVHPQPESYWGNVNTIGPRVSSS